MIRTPIFSSTLRICWLGILLGFASLCARAEVPALAPVPAFLPAELKSSYTARRAMLETQLAKFQKDSEAFNHQPAEKQSDAEYDRLQGVRADYVAKAETFNRDVVAVGVYYGQLEKMRVAGKPLALASAFKGDFYIELADGRRFRGDEARVAPLDGKTKIVTGDASKVIWLLPDETTVTIGANGTLLLDEFVYDPATGSPSQVAGQFVKGSLRWVTGKVQQAHTAGTKIIKLVIDAVGIRGTDFELQVDPDGSGWLKLHTGIVDITEKPTGRVVTLAPQQQIHFAASGALDPVEALVLTAGEN